MRRSTLTLALLLASCATIATVGAVAFAQEMQPPINADEVKWGPAPPNIPAGAQIAVLAGNPASDGPYVVRLKMPANYKVPAHYHPKDETVTVISGTSTDGRSLIIVRRAYLLAYATVLNVLGRAKALRLKWMNCRRVLTASRPASAK